MDKYTAYNCNRYDQLEAWAVQKKTLRIVFQEGEEQAEIQTQIATLQTENKAEFLITTTGEKIRLDKLLALEVMD